MALPPRKEARQRGRSVFVADDLKPYPDQWVYLATPRRLSVAGPQTLSPSATGGAHPLDLAFIDEEQELPSSLTLTLADRLDVERQGRLHRQQGGKTSVRMINWLNLGHPVPQRMWERRLRGLTPTTYGCPPHNEAVAVWCAMSPAKTALHAAIEAIDEPRSARMDQRTKPSVKASIEAAAHLIGIEAPPSW